MFLDSILGPFNSIIGLQSQIIATTGNIITYALSILGQIAGNIGGTIGHVANTAGQTVLGVGNIAGQTVSNVASTASDLIGSPVMIVGIAIVLVVLLKK